MAGLEQTRQQTDDLDAHGSQRYTARLLIACPDRPGIVAAVSGFLFERGANIVSSHQYSTDPTGGRFFLRTEFFLEPTVDRDSFQASLEEEVGTRFGMDWEIRWRRGELEADIAAVISNHPDLCEETLAAGVPYHHVPVQASAKEQAEAAMLELLRGNAELLVLARYMQILSGGFLEQLGMPAINIHHSFLPAFAGADPYRQAHDHGVKLIGATAHYVTEQLDDGPIIDQDVVRVDHRQSARDLERLGRDVERLVLARAVMLHLDDRVIVDGRRTIVF